MHANTQPSLVLGSRGSPLALAQTHLTAAALRRAHGLAEAALRIEVITTTGDATQDRPLSEIGGKGLFTKEIDLAQLEGQIDLAIHSAKDLPTELPEGLVIAGFLPREDVRDALIAPRARTLAALPQGARIGTVSLRRQAMLKALRPDLRVEALRGNVGTRLEKARSGEFDAVLLATAGLNRLGLAEAITEFLPIDSFLPAVGQGAIALVTRHDDTRLQALLAAIIHPPTGIAVRAERALLKVLDGSCRTPIGGHAVLEADQVYVRAVVLSPDGSAVFAQEGRAPHAQAEQLGEQIGQTLRARLPAGFLHPPH